MTVYNVYIRYASKYCDYIWMNNGFMKSENEIIESTNNITDNKLTSCIQIINIQLLIHIHNFLYSVGLLF